MRSSSKKITRIFVARIPLSVTEAAFRSHWRDIGFVHAQDSVDTLMFETHELGGSDVVVDRATPKVTCGVLLCNLSSFILHQFNYFCSLKQ
ncbi:hypothetical protein HanIR_Chr14g0676431 [Helianthus annuus]|nr:hypothetical protein HanIR_Chr14g0676431 [Helianthus annuus]